MQFLSRSLTFAPSKEANAPARQRPAGSPKAAHTHTHQASPKLGHLSLAPLGLKLAKCSWPTTFGPCATHEAQRASRAGGRAAWRPTGRVPCSIRLIALRMCAGRRRTRLAGDQVAGQRRWRACLGRPRAPSLSHSHSGARAPVIGLAQAGRPLLASQRAASVSPLGGANVATLAGERKLEQVAGQTSAL